MTLTTLKASLISLILPNRCPGCDALLYPGELLCADCEGKVLLPHDDYCHTCGKLRCFCQKRTVFYDRAIICSRYTADLADPAVRSVWALKNTQNTNFARFAAKIIAERLRHSLDYGNFDLVTAVPMHPSKKRIRGYNQAALIGKALAQELGLPYRDDLLTKSRSRAAQHNLSAKERLTNVAAFDTRNVDLTGKRILLCDDVLTTGATMDRCAALLKADGAAFVCAAAAATTSRKEESKEELP